MAAPLETVNEHYCNDIQMSFGQAQVIAGAISLSGPAPNVLVFGCGNDSPMWHALAADGSALFIEDNEGWLADLKSRYPYLDIMKVNYRTTVATSLPVSNQKLMEHEIPEQLLSREWDVILIDAPNGYKDSSKGRSVPIFWASKIATAKTHIFVDDHQRELEKKYSVHFFGHRIYRYIIPRVVRHGKRNSGEMLWILPNPI